MAIEKGEVSEKVKKVVAEVLDMDPEEVPDDANFIFDLGADSMQSIKLIAAFNEEFEIEMDEDQAASVQTVSEAIEFIQKYLK